MGDRVDEAGLRRLLAERVAAAGGATRWLREHELSGFEAVTHMVADGRLATDERVLPVLGFRRLVVYRALDGSAEVDGAGLCDLMARRVREGGGAKRWLRRHKVFGFEAVTHMVSDGRIATHERVLPALGFERAVLYEGVPEEPVPSGPRR